MPCHVSLILDEARKKYIPCLFRLLSSQANVAVSLTKDEHLSSPPCCRCLRVLVFAFAQLCALEEISRPFKEAWKVRQVLVFFVAARCVVGGRAFFSVRCPNAAL